MIPLDDHAAVLDSAPSLAIPRPRGAPGDRRLIIMVSASLGLHLLAALGFLLLVRMAPVASGEPEKPAEIELVMEERKGDIRPQGGPPPTQETKAREETKESPTAKEPREDTAEKQKPTEPPVEARADEPEETVQPPKESVAAPSPPAAAQAPAQSVPPAPQPAPVISLSGTDSPSYALAYGNNIIPAAPNAVFHNRPPEYPMAAAMAGEQGTVVLRLRLSPEGTVAGVAVVRSTGHPRLDQAAIDAVVRWRFLPAVNGGRNVASETEVGFHFDNN